MLTREEWKKRKRRIWYIKIALAGIAAVMIIVLVIFAVKSIVGIFSIDDGLMGKTDGGVKVNERLITVCEDTRPGIALEKVNGIVIHYVGKKGISAIADRNYYERLHILNEGAANPIYASVHYIVGITGEIIQCIPMNEVAYASKDRNRDTIAIEYCHDDDDGKPSDAAYKSLVDLTATLCKEYKLTEQQVLRHYDITQALCPVYYVDNEIKWTEFISDVATAIK